MCLSPSTSVWLYCALWRTGLGFIELSKLRYAQDTKACGSSRGGGGGRLITGLFTRSVSDNSYASISNFIT